MNASFVFQNKASTLVRLEGVLSSARVLPQTTIGHGAWLERPEAEVRRVLAHPWARRHLPAAAAPLIVRSCASEEDGRTASLAGHFTSVQNVIGPRALARAVDRVFASYGGSPLGGQVLVQPMLLRPVASGVATSCEVGSGRPYVVISTSHGADTTAVTGGRTNEAETYYHFRGALQTPAGREGAVLRMLREVEAHTQLASLDIEFAFVDGEDLPILLQARPLVDGATVTAARDAHGRQLALAEQQVRTLLRPHPLAHGRRSVLSCMTDWNPAEMIGVRPRPLALSLYRSLITDSVWANQRHAYGYRDLAGFPLLIDVLGAPYIDVRASFESFIPAALSDAAVGPLVEYYTDRLVETPALHDKVEFEIVLSCYAFDIDDRLARLRRAGIQTQHTSDLRGALHALTCRLLNPVSSPRLDDLLALQSLRQRHQAILRSDLPPLASVYWLLDDCRRLGVRPFAGLARVGFIAMELLNSLVTVGVIDEADRDSFLKSVATVTTRMQRDLAQLAREDFLARYGHLRPGAYDILSPRYDEAPELYFGAPNTLGETATALNAPFAGEHQTSGSRLARAVEPLLARHGFDLGADALLAFIADGVRRREEAKFLFTRNLSDALAKLKQWGETVGLTPDDLAFGDIRVLDQCYGSTRNPVERFRAAIREGRQGFDITSSTCLPSVITDAAQVWGFRVPPATPSFITSHTVRGPVVADLDRKRLSGAIVLVRSADPGFDWIFAYPIAGLVTAFGGANSHMAIRAAELDLPAVIGAGERLFAEWSRAPGLSLDCANRRVDPIPMERRAS